ncbi:siderophore-interacting protein [Williamsia sp.]|uniref:siderophore-interacting protein n=1 Tax=Williamsia sp. TaxID=1872085 RepID=UPI002F931A05
MPKTIREPVVYPISVRELNVLRIVDVTPGLRRITLTGPQLGGFTSANGLPQPPLRSEGFDDDVRLILPYPGEDTPVLPIQLDGTFSMPKDRRPIWRAYTIRRWDPASAELTIDFVKHGSGMATTWAYRAQPGDTIHITGPAAMRQPPSGIDWLLIVGDETALPAIARWMDEMSADTRAQVFVEIAEAAHRIDLPDHPNVQVTWLDRQGATAGTTDLLIDAVENVQWWDGSVYAWIAGEATVTKKIRRHLVEKRGVGKEFVEFTGYWRHADVVTLADDPTVPDPDKNEEAFEKLHEMADLLPPLAIRAAVSLGLPDAISRGITGAVELAEAASADEVAVGKLLRYLTAIEILESAERPGHYRLSDSGEFLTTDFVVDILHRDGPVGRQELAYFGIFEAVKTGRASYASVTGNEYSELRQEQWYEAKLLENIADFAQFIAQPLAASDLLGPIKHVVVRSDGAGPIARALTGAHADVRVTIVGLPAQIAYLKEDMPRSVESPEQLARIALREQGLDESLPASDATMFVRWLDQFNDADAIALLRSAAADLEPGGRIMVLEDPFDTETLDEHAAEYDLLHLSLYGSGHRDDCELRAVFAGANLIVENFQTVGWGNTLYVLTPAQT